MRPSDLGKELLAEWRRHGPYRCHICGRCPTNPHHIHAAADPYWLQLNLSPHHSFNIRPLCLSCHAEIKHILGEFHFNFSPTKRASRIARVKEFLRTFKQKHARELVPGWCLEEVAFNATPGEPYKEEIEQIRKPAEEGGLPMRDNR